MSGMMNLISMSSQQITCPNYVIAGNVGIGTTNPTQQLDVNGAIAVGGVMVIDASGNITTSNIAGTTITASNIISSNITATIFSGAYYGSGEGLTGIPWSALPYTPIESFTTPTSLPATTFTGNVGVLTNTAAPIAPFTVWSNFTSATGDSLSGLCIDANDSPGAAVSTYNLRLYSYIQAAGQTGYKFAVYNNGTLTDSALTFGYNGRIGIGNTAPATALDVVGAIAISGTTVIDASGNITGGTVTATTFSGSGESLTGLNASNVSTGTLALANGGTNAAITAVNGGIVYSTASSIAISAAGVSGNILRSNGAAPPTWEAFALTGDGSLLTNIQTSNVTGLASVATTGSYNSLTETPTTIATATNVSGGTVSCTSIYCSGNVGIGKTNPVDKLEVGGNVVATGGVFTGSTALSASSDSGLIASYLRIQGLTDYSNTYAVASNVNGGAITYTTDPAGGTNATVFVTGGANYLDITTTGGLSVPLTVGVWAKLVNLSTNQTFVNIGATGNNSGLTIGFSTTLNTVSVSINNANASSYYPATAGTWTHYAATFSNYLLTFFVNGVQVSAITTTSNTFTSGGTNIRLGEDLGLGIALAGGALYDMRVYSRVLTALELQGLALNTPAIVQTSSTAVAINAPVTINVPSTAVVGSTSVGTLATVGFNLTKDLAVWMPFEGSVADAVGGVNANLTLTGSVSYVQGPCGVNSRALYLNNTAGGTAANYLSLNYTFPGTFTISCWVNFAAIGAPMNTFISIGTSSSDNIFLAYDGTVGSLYVYCYTRTAGQGIVGGTPYFVPNANTWYHITLTFTLGNFITLYLNGVLFKSDPVTGVFGNNGVLLIGSEMGAMTRSFAGAISDFRIYNTALSASDVQTLYASYPNMSLAGAISYFPFDGNLSDYMGLNTLIVTGGVSYVKGCVGGTGATGTVGKSVYLANESNVLAISTPASKYMTMTYTFPAAVTFSCWINITKLPLNVTYFSYVFNTQPASANVAIALVVYPTYISATINTLGYTANYTGIAVNTWYHCVVTVVSNVTSLYVNGTLIGILSGTVTVTSNTSLLFGNATTTGTLPFAGYIDDFRIYNRALAAPEVAALYTSGNSQSLIAQFPFESSLDDATGNGTALLPITGAIVPYSTNCKQGSYSLQLTNTLSASTKAVNSLQMALPIPTTSATTIVCWINPATVPTAGLVSTIWSVGTSSNEAFTLFANSSGQLQVGTSNNAGTVYYQTAGAASTVIAVNTWTHTAAVFDPAGAGNNYLYVNGGLLGTFTTTIASSTAISANSLISLGDSTVTTTYRGYSGLIDDFRVYNRPLTAGEIKLLAGSSFVSGLTQYYPFDGSLMNSVSGGASLTLTGVVSYVTGGIGTNAVYLANEANVLATATRAANYLTTSAVVVPTGAHSISCWIYVTKIPLKAGGSTIWSFGSTTVGGGSLLCTTTMTLYATYNAIGTTTSTAAISINTWYHVCITYIASGAYNIYLNGRGYVSTATATAFAANTILLIGDSCVSTALLPFAGYIDDFRIYNRVLTASEISTLYFLGTPIITYPLNNALQPIKSVPVITYPFQKDYLDYATIGGAGTVVTGTLQYVQGVNGGRALYLANEANVLAATHAANTIAIPYIQSTAISISSWIYWKPNTATAAYPWIIGSSTNYGIGIYLNSNSTNMYVQGPGFGAGPVVVSWNTWIHTTVVYIPSVSITLYVNGVLGVTVTPGNVPSVLSNNGLISLGDFAGGGNWPFAGYIDDFRIYNRALTAAEISQIYTTSTVVPAITNYTLPTTYPVSNIVNGLTAWYRYEAVAPTLDSAYNLNTIVLTGATANASVYKADASSLYFNNATAGGTATQYATDALTNTIPSRNFTVATWFQTIGATTSGSQMLLNIGGSANVYGLQLSLNTSNVITLGIASSASTFQTLSTTAVIPTNTWTHVVAVHSAPTYSTSPTASIYVNGVLVTGTLPLTLQALPNATALRLGADLSAGIGNAFAGYLNDTRIYNRALTASEISTLYGLYATSTVTQSQVAITSNAMNASALVASGLVSYLPFDGNVLDVASVGGSNSVITYGNTPTLNSVASSNVKFVVGSVSGASAMYLANNFVSAASAQQTHVDVTLPAVTGALTVANWFMVPQVPSSGSNLAIYNVGSTGYSTNGLLLSFGQNTATGPLRTWPPAAPTITVASSTTTLPSATGVVSGQSYGNGGYVIKASTCLSATYYPEKAFNKNDADFWHSAGPNYNATTFVYTLTTNGVGTYYGEWLQIQLATATVLTSYALDNSTASYTYLPSSFNLYGSNDGVTWSLLNSQTNLPASTWYGVGLPVTFAILNNSIAYSFYRIVINKIVGNATYTIIPELILYDNYAPTLSLQAASVLQTTTNTIIPINPLAPTQALTITPGTWYHSTVTFDTSNIKLYLDGNTSTPLFQGALNTSATSIQNMTTTPMVRFGDILSTTNTTSAFNGYISDWRLYNRVLTAAEISALYQTPQTLVAPSNAILGWWQFENNLVDSSTNNYNGVGVGIGASYVTGKVGTTALNLSNTPGTIATSYVDFTVKVATVESAGLDIGAMAYSLSLWVKPTSFSGNNGFVDGTPSFVLSLVGQTGVAFGRALDISLTSLGVPQVTYIDLNDVATVLTSSGGAIVVGNWYHIAVVWTGYSVALYVSGILMASSNSVPFLTGLYTKLRLGDYVGGGFAYNGAIDDMRWYNHALSLDEVQRLNANLFVTGTSGSTALTLGGGLDVSGGIGVNGTMVIDSSQNISGGTLTSSGAYDIGGANGSRIKQFSIDLTNTISGYAKLSWTALQIGCRVLVTGAQGSGGYEYSFLEEHLICYDGTTDPPTIQSSYSASYANASYRMLTSSLYFNRATKTLTLMSQRNGTNGSINVKYTINGTFAFDPTISNTSDIPAGVIVTPTVLINNDTGTVTATNFIGNGYFGYTNAANYVASTGTWTADAAAGSWHNTLHFSPNDGKLGQVYNSTAAPSTVSTDTIEYTVLAGAKSCTISSLNWNTCGYVDIYGRLTGTTNYNFLFRHNTINSVSNIVFGVNHDGVCLIPVSSITIFDRIRISVKKGRFHCMGVGWSYADRQNHSGTSTGQIHSDNIYWDGTGTVTAASFSGNVTGNCTGSSGSCTGNANTSSSCSGNANTSSSCSGNAASAYGLACHGGTNNEANKVVRTDGNGYTNFGWINTISGDNSTTGITRIYASQDAYIRYYTPANFKSVLSLVSSGDSPTFAEVYTNGWFRNNNAGTGLYNQARGCHFLPSQGSYGNWEMYGAAQNTWQGIRFHGGGTDMNLMMGAGSDKSNGVHNNSSGWMWLCSDNRTFNVYGGLYVNGNLLATNSGWYFNNNGNNAISAYGYGERLFGISAAYAVLSVGFFAMSDERIKTKIHGAWDDLALINQLEVVRFRHKDKLRFPSEDGEGLERIGFIAQDVQKILPMGVTPTTGVIPDIQQVCLYSSSNISYTGSNITIGDTINIVNDNSDLCGFNVKVTGISGSNIAIDDPSKITGSNVFVYGHEVTDFLTLNLEAITAVSVGAIQRLSSIVKSQQVQIDAQQSQINSLTISVERLLTAAMDSSA